VLGVTAVAIVVGNLFEGVLVGLALAVAKTAWDISHVHVETEDLGDAGIVVRVLGHATFLRLPKLLDALEGLPGTTGWCGWSWVGCGMWIMRVRRRWRGGPPGGGGGPGGRAGAVGSGRAWRLGGWRGAVGAGRAVPRAPEGGGVTWAVVVDTAPRQEVMARGRRRQFHDVGLLHDLVREDGAEVVPFLGEEGGRALLVVDQEGRVAADVGQVRVDRDVAAPADPPVGEVESAGGVGERGTQAAAVLLHDAVDAEVDRMRSDCSAIHGMSRAPVFHHSASAPPGRSTRSASGTDRAGSVQCQAWA
jgi:hypothetical protein